MFGLYGIRCLLEFCGISSANDGRRPQQSQSARDGRANATAPSGHHCDFFLKIFHVDLFGTFS